MGLDMTICKLQNTRVNERGNTVYEYERIADLRNSWQFYDNLNSLSEFGFGNGAEFEFSGSQIWEELNGIDDKEEQNYVKKVIEQANIKNSDEEFYKVNAWW